MVAICPIRMVICGLMREVFVDSYAATSVASRVAAHITRPAGSLGAFVDGGGHITRVDSAVHIRSTITVIRYTGTVPSSVW